MIENHERPSRTASWWWVLSIACLGPVAISRLESIVVPLTVIAVLVLPKRPAMAAALLTFAGWIKVFPIVWLIPLALSQPKKAGRMIASSAAVSAALMVPVLLLGGGSRMFGFLTAQTGRGLQIESVPASFLQIGRLWGDGPRPIYSTKIITWQFETHGAEVLGRIATLLTVPAVLGTLLLIGISLRRAPERRMEILAAGLFAVTLALIVFNQVGSPQYMAWVSAAVILGLLSRSPGDHTWPTWGAMILVMDAMTQAIYPHFYLQLIRGEPIMVLMLVGRNVLLVGLFVAAIRWLLSVRRSVVPATA